MQAVYFIALFGLVFAVISSFTVGISANTMQVKESKIEEVQRNFDNLEFAITNVYLKERTNLQDDIPSLASAGAVTTLGQDDLNIFLPYMRTSGTDLVMDPWRTPITYYAFQNPVVFCSDTSPDNDYDCWVEAPVVYFVMVSAGPNRQFESGPEGNPGGMPNADPIDMLSYRNPPESDDIVKVFSTESAMRNHYNNMVAVEDRVASLMLKSYRDQAGSFFESPAVKEYIEDRLTEVLGDDGFFGDRPPTPVAPGGANDSASSQTMEFERSVEPQNNGALQVMEFRQSNDGAGGNNNPPCTNNCFPIDITQEEIFGEILELDEAQTWPGYPRMRGTYDENTPNGEPTPINASAYGAESELQFDPFCLGENRNSCLPFSILYDNAEPWKASIERDPISMGSANGSGGNSNELGGWRVYTRKIVDGKKEL